MSNQNLTTDYQSKISWNKKLIAIVLLGAALRILFLAQAPNTFSTDEASNGYDSYSILLTLRDRYGDFLPVFPIGFNDSRELIYVLLTTPFIKLLGLNEFAVRLPSAIVGTLTIIAVYYLAKEAFKSDRLAIYSALLLAINPWSIFFSRIAFRAGLLPLIFSVAVLFFLKSFTKPNYLILSSIFFSLSLYTYSSARVFVPLFVLGVTVIYWRRLWQIKIQTLIAIIIFSGVFLFLLQYWMSPTGIARAAETKFETNFFQLIYNYLSYFYPVFLFFYGDISERRSVTAIGIGEFYIWEILTIFPGIYVLFKQKKKQYAWMFLWLLLYPLPAAVTEPAHAIRGIVGIPLFCMFSAYGISIITNWFTALKKKKNQRIAQIVILLSFIYFIVAYFNFSQYKIGDSVGHWQYGMREAITYAENSNYDAVYVSNSFKRPNMYLLFYTKYPPAKYQQNPDAPELQYFERDRSYGKYTITQIEKHREISTLALFIIKADEKDRLWQQYPNARELKVIKMPNNQEKIRLIEVSPSRF